MPRVYNITFEQVSVSAAQDLVQIIGAAGKTVRVRKCWVGMSNTSLPTAQMCSTRFRFLPATVTNGSGGSSPTAQPLDPGDSAASVTAKANNTTKATTNGTASTLYENGWHAYAGEGHWRTTDHRPIRIRRVRTIVHGFRHGQHVRRGYGRGVRRLIRSRSHISNFPKWDRIFCGPISLTVSY